MARRYGRKFSFFPPRLMNAFLLYVFYPNPGHLTYGSMQVVAILVLCVVLIALSFGINYWRGRVQNSITKKLTRAWSSISFWFGVVGLVLIVARVEKIQFIAMRFLWVLWVAALAFAIFVQYRLFRMRHYEVMPRVMTKEDPRAKYMPGKKR